MKTYQEEQPQNDQDYPEHMDSTDMMLQAQAAIKSAREFRDRLLAQIEDYGVTNCGIRSKEVVNQMFAKAYGIWTTWTT